MSKQSMCCNQDPCPHKEPSARAKAYAANVVSPGAANADQHNARLIQQVMDETLEATFLAGKSKYPEKHWLNWLANESQA